MGAFPSSRLAPLLASLALLTVAGCGTEGTIPAVIPEYRFLIQPLRGGEARFRIRDVRADGERYANLVGRELVTSGRFQVFVENAAGNVGIVVCTDSEANPIEVRFGRVGVDDLLGRQVIISFSEGVEECALVGSTTTSESNGWDLGREVRIDVCAPDEGAACSPIDGIPGAFGVPFAGSIGDPFATRLLGPAASDQEEVGTPAMIFYVKARSSISARVTANDRRLLHARLCVDGGLADEQRKTENVVVRSDL